MTSDFKQQLQELIDQAAEKSVDRNMLELRDADARVRHFKQGCKFLMPVMMKAVEQRDDGVERLEGWELIQESKYNQDLLNILKGEGK